jgi:hypothetical protein
MMVNPREDLNFEVCGKVENVRFFERQRRKMKLICFEFEANRNVSGLNARQGASAGLKKAC